MKDKFSVGQRVLMVRPIHAKDFGMTGTIASDKRREPGYAKPGYLVDWDAHSGDSWFEDEISLAPIWPGSEKCSWSDCARNPLKVTA